MASPLRSYLLQGGRRVFGFIETRSSIAVDFQSDGGADPFFNINTPENLAEAERIVREGSA
jgi:molybdopterin-guanine dinucleotide biosynthesis protein A